MLHTCTLLSYIGTGDCVIVPIVWGSLWLTPNIMPWTDYHYIVHSSITIPGNQHSIPRQKASTASRQWQCIWSSPRVWWCTLPTTHQVECQGEMGQNRQSYTYIRNTYAWMFTWTPFFGTGGSSVAGGSSVLMPHPSASLFLQSLMKVMWMLSAVMWTYTCR